MMVLEKRVGVFDVFVATIERQFTGRTMEEMAAGVIAAFARWAVLTRVEAEAAYLAAEDTRYEILQTAITYALVEDKVRALENEMDRLQPYIGTNPLDPNWIDFNIRRLSRQRKLLRRSPLIGLDL